MARRWAWWIGLGLILVVLLAFGTWRLSQEIPGLMARLKDTIQEEAEALGLQVSFRNLHFHPLHLRFSLEDLEIRDGIAGVPLARAGNVDLSLSPWRILSGRSPVSRVLVRTFSVHVSEANRPLLSDLRRSRNGKGEDAIPEVILLDGDVRSVSLGPLERWEAKVPQVRLWSDRFRKTRITATIRGSKGRIVLPGTGSANIPFDSADAVVSFKGDSIQIVRFFASGPSAKITFAGKWEGAERTIAMDLSGETDIAGWTGAGAPGGNWIRRVATRGKVVFSGQVKGPVEGPEGSGKIMARDLLLPGGTPADVNGSLSVSGRKVRLDSLRGTVWDGDVAGNGTFDFRTGEGDARFSIRKASFGKAPWESWGMTWRPAGSGDLALSLSGGRDMVRATISLVNPDGFERPAGDGIRAAQVSLPITATAVCDRIRGGKLGIREFRATAGRAEVTGRGEHVPADGSLSFSGKFLVPPGKAAEYGFVYPLSWRNIAGDWKMSGTADAPHVTAAVRAEGIAARALPPVPLSVKLDGRPADVIHFVADIPADVAKVTATGTIAGPLSRKPLLLEATIGARNIDFSLAGAWGSAVLSSLGKNPADFRMRASGMSGTGNADLGLSIAEGSYSLTGTVSSPEIRFPGIRARFVSISGSWGEAPSGPHWRLRADGEFGDGTFHVTGRGEGGKGNLAGALEEIELPTAISLINPEFGKRVGGRASLRVEAGKGTNGWEIGKLSVSVPRLSAAGMIIEQVSAEGSLGASSGDLSIVSASPPLNVSANLRREKGWPVSFSLRADKVPTAMVLEAVGRREVDATGTWSGFAEGTLEIEEALAGRTFRPEAVSSFRFSLTADSPSFSRISFDSVHAGGKKEKDGLTGEIGTGAPGTNLSFTLSLREPFSFRVEGPFTVGEPNGPVPKSHPAASADGIPAKGNGNTRLGLAGTAQISGSLLALENTRGTLAVRRMHYRDKGIDLSGEEISVQLTSEGIRWTKGVLLATGNPLRVAGRASWAGDLDVRLDGKAPAAAIRLATDVFDRLDGIIRIELRVTGKWDDPVIIGNGRLENGTFSFRGYAQLFEEMNADAVISREKIIFEDFDGRSGGGYIDGRGELPLGFADGQKMFFSVDFFDMRYPYPEDLRPVLQGHVELIGPLDDLLITGDVEVQSARYTKTVRPEQALLDFRRRLADVTARRQESDFRIRFDLEAVADGTIRVQNNLAQADIKGEFKVVGDSSRVILLGAFDITEGLVEYRGNRYELSRGTLEFQDPRRNNPRLDFRAETKKGNVIVTVAVSGTLEKYEVELFSDPPLSKNDIVSLLSLGVTSESLAGASGSVSAAEAAAIALGPYKGRVEEGIRDVIGLDRFAIEPSFSSTDKSPEPRFVVGKTFGDRFSVSVSTNVGTTTESSALAEYKLLENVYLQGAWQSATTTREGDLGGDVKFRYRFRQFRDIFRGGD